MLSCLHTQKEWNMLAVILQFCDKLLEDTTSNKTRSFPTRERRKIVLYWFFYWVHVITRQPSKMEEWVRWPVVASNRKFTVWGPSRHFWPMWLFAALWGCLLPTLKMTTCPSSDAKRSILGRMCLPGLGSHSTLQTKQSLCTLDLTWWGQQLWIKLNYAYLFYSSLSQATSDANLSNLAGVPLV